MPKTGIITDTISCLPHSIVKELNIHLVPIGLIIDGKRYLDTDLTTEEFWKLFFKLKEQPTTAAANPTSFATAYTELSKSTNDIVCITVSSKLSATHGASVQAKNTVIEEKPKLNIEVIDSTTAAGAQGLIVMEAARAAQAGKSLNEVVQVIKDMVLRVKYLCAMDTLKYLIKSGRAPKTAVLGDMMGVRPIIGMVSGTGLVENMGRARGKQKAKKKMVDMMQEHTDTSKPVHVIVHYTDSIAAGEELKDMVTSRYNCTEAYLTPFTPVMGSQTGPVVAIGFYS